MKEIKLKDSYKLIVVGEYTRDEIKSSIAKTLNKVVEMDSSYLNILRLRVLMEDNTYEYLNLMFDKINGISMTTISYEVRGKLVCDKEIYEKEPTIMYKLCEGLCGLLWVDKFKVEYCCERYKASYFINHKKDSVKYQLINHAIKEMNFVEPKEIVAFAELIEQNRNFISKVLL